jgi:ADP-heptose:LPS heptosyltransferase
MPESSPSVLLIRLDAVGDALAVAPVLAALAARAIPVDIILTQRNLDVFTARAARHRIAAPFALHDESAKNLAAIALFGAVLAKNGYSHALVATEDPSGYRLAQASRAASRIGFENGWGRPLKTLWIRSMLTQTLHRPAGLVAGGSHECAALFQLGAPLLDDGQEPTHDLAQLRPLVIDEEPPDDARIALQVTNRWDRLGIAFNDVVGCAQKLAAQHSLRAIGSSLEAEYVARFALASGIAVERFDALAPWKAALAAARALVAPDSGALHVAGMVGTPTVAIFAPKGFAAQTARWHPWAAPYRAIEAAADWSARTTTALQELLDDDSALL